MAAEAGSPKPRVLVWLAACAAALTLLVGVLALAVDGGDGDQREPSEPGRIDRASSTAAITADWETLASPALPADAVAGDRIVLTSAGGRLLVVSWSDSPSPAQVWAFEDGTWSGPVAVPGRPRSQAALVGTPRELVIWGGLAGGAVTGDGLAYDLVSREWRQLPTSPLPPSQGAIGLWTGREVVVVAGAEAAAYDPARDDWRELSSAPDLEGATPMAAAWSGGQAVVWAYDEPARESHLQALDVAAGLWTALPPPPFGPAGGTTGLAGAPAGLVATTTEFRSSAAAVLDWAGPAWRTLAAPPIPSNVVCTSDLVYGGAGTVLLSRCSGELFLLDGDVWRRLPPLPGAAAGRREGTQALVSDDAVYYLAPAGAGAPAGAAPSLVRLPLR